MDKDDPTQYYAAQDRVELQGYSSTSQGSATKGMSRSHAIFSSTHWDLGYHNSQHGGGISRVSLRSRNEQVQTRNVSRAGRGLSMVFHRKDPRLMVKSCAFRVVGSDDNQSARMGYKTQFPTLAQVGPGRLLAIRLFRPSPILTLAKPTTRAEQKRKISSLSTSTASLGQDDRGRVDCALSNDMQAMTRNRAARAGSNRRVDIDSSCGRYNRRTGHQNGERIQAADDGARIASSSTVLPSIPLKKPSSPSTASLCGASGSQSCSETVPVAGWIAGNCPCQPLPLHVQEGVRQARTG